MPPSESPEISHATFEPVPWLKDGHAMTIASALWRRKILFDGFRGVKRIFKLDAENSVSAYWHCQPGRPDAPTVIVLHGLEGDAHSHYVCGIALKALRRGLNVLRLNMRNCDGTFDLCQTLYNAGMSKDILEVARQLAEVDLVKEIFLTGYSLGGNIVVKAAGEIANTASYIKGVCAVSPSLDLAACADQLEKGFNQVYERRFLVGLKTKLRIKSRQIPEKYDRRRTWEATSIRTFDDLYTAPDGGYGNASNYYHQASALRVMQNIAVPTLIIASADDPIVPIACLKLDSLDNKYVTPLTVLHGGHGGFIHRDTDCGTGGRDSDRFWAENRLVDFIAAHVVN